MDKRNASRIVLSLASAVLFTAAPAFAALSPSSVANSASQDVLNTGQKASAERVESEVTQRTGLSAKEMTQAQRCAASPERCAGKAQDAMKDQVYGSVANQMGVSTNTVQQGEKCMLSPERCQQKAANLATQRAQQMAAEQLAAKSGMPLTQAKNVIGDCPDVSRCMNNAQKGIEQHMEKTASLQLVQSTGMPLSMANALTRGCSSKQNGCTEAVQKQGEKYMTETATKLTSQYLELGKSASRDLVNACKDNGDECTEEMKEQAAKKLMKEAGLSNSEARKLLTCAEDTDRCQEHAKDLAKDYMQQQAKVQLNEAVKSGFAQVGMNGMSLGTVMGGAQMLKSLYFSFNKRDVVSVDTLGKVSAGVVRANQGVVYKQVNSYNASTQGALYYGNNNSNLSSVIKNLKTTAKNEIKAAVKGTATPGVTSPAPSEDGKPQG